MTPSFIGAIYAFGGNFAIYGFALCQGQLQSIAENSTLFTLIGTTFGGDGVQTFGLPDLRGRLPIGQGTGPGLPPYVIGQAAGTENISLNVNTMPAHTHTLNSSTIAGTTATPAANSSYLAAPYTGTVPDAMYNAVTTGVVPMNNATIVNAGSSLPFSIIQPVQAMNYVISLYGIFPSRN